MTTENNNSRWKWLRIGGTVAVIAVVGVTYNLWWPHLSDWVDHSLSHEETSDHDDHDDPDHEDHTDHDDHSDPDHVAHDEEEHGDGELELSKQALKNLGLTDQFLKPIELTTYRRMLTVPARVVTRPGRSHVKVSTPLTGVITHVHAVTGESVIPGTLLFEIRLTHEDLVKSQTDFLVMIGELEVESYEIARLTKAAEGGGLALKKLIERRHNKEKLEINIQAQREALRLHGLSEAQIDGIASEKRLLRDLQIVAPSVDAHEHPELRLSRRPQTQVAFHAESSDDEAGYLEIEELTIRKGQAVTAGEHLCTLADFSRLHIQGQAFEQDAALVASAVEHDWTVNAIFPGINEPMVVENLKLAFLSNQVEVDSRTLPFFVDLPNQKLRNVINEDGQRHIAWEFRPGQRLQVQVPVEEWPEMIVLPIEAVVKEGANWYVFEQHHGHFDQVPVHVQYRDQRTVVIANDGSIHPGDVVAMKAAHQMLMAVKNQSGGGIDPHAGHTH